MAAARDTVSAGARGTVTPPREGQTFAGTGALARYASFVKLPHTLFALPFAGLGLVLATYEHPVTVVDVVLIVLAFSAARFAAMGFNRLVDGELDARNPRTVRRELVTGAISVRAAAVAVGAAALAFVASAFALNPLAGWLSPVALAWILAYSYTKRITIWSHHVLGLALGIAPVGGYLAIAGAWPEPWYSPVVLALAVAFWVAGFDVIYAIQDVEFDRAERLHSIPARLGRGGALVWARLFHAAAVALFLLFWFVAPAPVGPLYLAGVGVAGGLLAYEHSVVRAVERGGVDASRIDRAFFRVNVLVAMGLFLFTLADRIVPG
ncbi:MAG: UbiA family prenyltransferase [Gemmatimonadetes bacterium]|nr:UbiA family prenyltransferase [Gemmatimonadota bacterium]